MARCSEQPAAQEGKGQFLSEGPSGSLEGCLVGVGLPGSAHFEQRDLRMRVTSGLRETQASQSQTLGWRSHAAEEGTPLPSHRAAQGGERAETRPRPSSFLPTGDVCSWRPEGAGVGEPKTIHPPPLLGLEKLLWP